MKHVEIWDGHGYKVRLIGEILCQYVEPLRVEFILHGSYLIQAFGDDEPTTIACQEYFENLISDIQEYEYEYELTGSDILDYFASHFGFKAGLARYLP